MEQLRTLISCLKLGSAGVMDNTLVAAGDVLASLMLMLFEEHELFTFRS